MYFSIYNKKKKFFIFYRGYLQSFSTVLKSPRTSVNNVIIKTENSDEQSESICSKLNDPNDVNKNNENNCQAKQISVEAIKEVY